MPFFDKLKSYRDVEVASQGAPFPLVVFSHGRGSNGLYYAWFAEFLASRGYIVAALNHYRANTYDSTIAYLANKLWQRPRDVGLTISSLLNDPVWGKSIDAARIGVAGHSQGGFTALWIGGAKVTPTSISPSSAAGAITPSCRHICVRSCRSMPALRST
jgi:predicted dienelactone hydrolase